MMKTTGLLNQNFDALDCPITNPTKQMRLHHAPCRRLPMSPWHARTRKAKGLLSSAACITDSQLYFFRQSMTNDQLSFFIAPLSSSLEEALYKCSV